MPTTESIRFVGSQGAELAGVLHRADPPALGSVLLAHCFTCSKDVRTLRRLAGGLADAGYTTLRFDVTGLGDSDGDFARTTVSANASDLVRAATTLIERGFGPCVLIGHSLGGAAAILAASRLKTVRALVTIGAPSSVGHVTELFAGHLDELRANGRAKVRIGGRPFELEQGFVDDLARHDVKTAIGELDRPVLVIHARDDEVVSYEQGLELFAAAGEPKEMVTLASGGHLLGPIAAADAALDAILAWLGSPASGVGSSTEGAP